MWAPCLSYVMQGIKPRVSCVPDKRFTNQTTCTSCLVCLTSWKKSVNSTFLGTPRNSDFFAGLEEGDQGSGYEPYLKMIFAAAPTEAQVQLGLLILSDLETCFSLPPQNSRWKTLRMSQLAPRSPQMTQRSYSRSRLPQGPARRRIKRGGLHARSSGPTNLLLNHVLWLFPLLFLWWQCLLNDI